MKRIQSLYNLSFERKLNIAFTAMVMMSVALFALTYFSYKKFEETANWVSHTNKVMYFNEQVITEALNIETAARGYAITGRDIFLTPFHKAKKDVAGHIENLRKLTTDNERRQKDFTRIEKQIATKVALAEQIINLRKTAGLQAAALFIEEGESRVAMDAIRNSVAKLQQEEIELLDKRQASHLKWLRVFNMAMFISLLFMVIVLVISAKNISNNFQSRRKAERDLAESQQVLQSIIDNTSVLIYIKDISGKFLLANKQYERVTSIPADELVGKRDSDFFPAEVIETFREADKKVFEGEFVEIEEPAYMNGESRMYLSVKFPLYDEHGKIYALCGMSTDITERKKAEEKILELNTTLEANVFRLNNINRELEAFTYSVSHDLRAPLRAINGFASLLINKTKNKADEETMRIVNIIKDNSQQMGQLIDDLLAFSRIGRYKPKLQETDMRELANMVLQQLTIDYPHHKVSLDIKSVEPVTCDPSLIKQVWVNLISNALKYSSQKEVQYIEIGSRKNNNEIVYYIKDNGAGFDMRYYDKLFGIFQRLHSNNDFEGTGVGLAIVHRIVKRHSGRVWAEGTVDKGATFYFSLPKVANVVEV